MSYYPATPFVPQFFTDTGVPLSGGTITAIVSGTPDTPAMMYLDATGTEAGTVITLNARGEPQVSGNTVVIWLDTEVIYKFILKDASGVTKWTINDIFDSANTATTFVDPVVTAPVFLKTVSDVINGERVSSMRWVASPAERAAIIAGTTTTDHTTILNQMFQDMKTSKKGNLYLHPGLWNSRKVTICSNIKIWAHGATWKARSDLVITDPMIINEVYDGTETGIEIYGGNFVGHSGLRSNSLVAFLRVDDLKIVGSEFSYNQDTGLALGGCTNFLLDAPHVHHCGRVAVTTEGGAAIYLGTYGTVPIENGTVRNALVHDCEWHGFTVGGPSATFPARDISLESPVIYRTKEAGIFGGYYDGLFITNPRINDITRKDRSSSGIELGGLYTRITGGLISDTDNAAISLTETQNVVISGIGTINAGRDAATFATACHIDILSLGGDGPRDILITGHTAIDYDSPCYGAVSIVGQSPGVAAANIDITGNHYSGTGWGSGEAIFIDPDYWGEGCIHTNNTGADDLGSISADKGDNSVTLRVGIEKEVQRFQTNLTSNRTVTLSTTAAYNGAKFKIVRSGLGAGTLDVGGLKTLPAATAAWCEVGFRDGSWVLTGYGLL